MTTIKNNSFYRNVECNDIHPILDDLYQNSMQDKSFNNLMDKITQRENILLAYRNIKKNKGSYTPGIDGKTIADVEKLNENEFLKIIRNKFKNYKPKNVKIIEIPKANGKMRSVGIPSIYDRIVQQCILQILEPICEAKFYDKSCGFRPNRSTEHAIAITMKMMQQSKLSFVVDIDIENFYNNVNHSKLIKQMWALGIRDKTLLSIIKCMLKAPIVLSDGKKLIANKGTSQSGILSQLLSNIVLNEFDWWIASQWEEIPTKKQYACAMHKNGSINRAHKYEALRKNTNLKEMYIVRYADDFKIFCRYEKEANRVMIAVKNWLNERLNLNISEESSKVTNLKKSYTEFLGFKLKLVSKGKKFIVKSNINDNALKRIKQDLKQQIEKIASPKNSSSENYEISIYNSKVIRIHNYYQIATCVQLDLDKIQYGINYTMHNSFHKGRKSIRISKKGKINNPYIREKYGKSKQIRFIHDHPIIPISYIRTKNAQHKKRIINKYTEEGRTEINKKQEFDTSIMLKMMQTKCNNATIEFRDNKISVYVAQKGKCAVSGKMLEYDDISCHHKIPKSISHDDSCKNLIIVSRDIHELIHASKEETIKKYLEKLNLNIKQIRRLNQLRKLLGIKTI